MGVRPPSPPRLGKWGIRPRCAAFAPKHSQCWEATGSIVRLLGQARDPSNDNALCGVQTLKFQGLVCGAAPEIERCKRLRTEQRRISAKNGRGCGTTDGGPALHAGHRYRRPQSCQGPGRIESEDGFSSAFSKARGARLAHARLAKGRLLFPHCCVPFGRRNPFKSRRAVGHAVFVLRGWRRACAYPL